MDDYAQAMVLRFEAYRKREGEKIEEQLEAQRRIADQNARVMADIMKHGFLERV